MITYRALCLRRCSILGVVQRRALDVGEDSTVKRQLMSIEQVAEFLQVPVATLYRWRSAGQGPVSVRVGRFVRYREEDVDAFVNAQLAQESTRRAS